jgi:hypothetical protein
MAHSHPFSSCACRTPTVQPLVSCRNHSASYRTNHKHTYPWTINIICIFNIYENTAAVQHCTAWYLALLQYRGALWFKKLVQFPGDQTQTKATCLDLGWRSASQVCDAMQGPLAPVITILLFILRITEQMPRSWFYSCLVFGSWAFGIRVFGAIVTNRIATLRRIAALQVWHSVLIYLICV